LNTEKSTFSKHQRTIYVSLGIIIAFAIIYALRSAILPFIVGIVLAYIFMPFINWIERKLPREGKFLQAKRVSLILLIYIIVLALIVALSYFIVTAIINAFTVLMNNAPLFIEAAVSWIQRWLASFQQQFPPEIQRQVTDLVTEGAVAIGISIREIFLRGLTAIPHTFDVIFGFATLPIFLFYIMKDWEKLGNGLYAGLSPTLATHARGVISILDVVLGRYIRAQLLLGFVVGMLCYIGLLIMRAPYAPALAALAGVTEVIPVLGPWIGGIVAVIVTLAITPEKAIWVAVLFLVVQLLENTLLVPRIHGAYFRINPAVVLVLLIVGAYLAGIWGMILAVPLTATAIELYKYVRRVTKPEESTPPVTQQQP
jgi:predicted PurR-regulated permease PerM